MRDQGHGTIVVLSSIAAIRPRKANLVYGATKAALDAFGRGLADSLHGSGVRVLLIRPGFVIGRMTAGMVPAPLATTPAAVGQAVATALARGDRDGVGSPVTGLPGGRIASDPSPTLAPPAPLASDPRRPIRALRGPIRAVRSRSPFTGHKQRGGDQDGQTADDVEVTFQGAQQARVAPWPGHGIQTGECRKQPATAPRAQSSERRRQAVAAMVTSSGITHTQWWVHERETSTPVSPQQDSPASRWPRRCKIVAMARPPAPVTSAARTHQVWTAGRPPPSRAIIPANDWLAGL